MKHFKMTKRLRILLGFIGVVALLLWFGQPIPQDQPQSNFTALSDAYPSVGTQITETGILTVVYGDEVDLQGQGETDAYLMTDAGLLYELETLAMVDVLPLNGSTVEISGILMDSDASSELDVPVLTPTNITPLERFDTVQNGVEGNERWINIACRFGDMVDVTPQPIEYFEKILVNQAPGMDHYWRQTSTNLVNIEGSGAYGWYDLPKDKTSYVRAASLNTGIALQMLLTDCARLAAEQDGVDFTQYGGINVMLNDTFGCCAWGGRMPLSINGKNITFRTTWLPPWAFNSLHVIAHEMGHGWGLPHSSGPYGKVYDSAWDVMSGGNSNHTDAICRIGNTDFGCYQVGTIGYHLDMLGWLPQERIVTVEQGTSATITLDALTTATSGIDHLLVKIPVANTDNFYTVEVRSFVAYDRNLPGEAVVLHEVVPGRPSPAHVVDGDNNGNPNDEGAMWLPGETFRDRGNGITVEVLERLGTTFVIRVTNN
jgi:hypothetical protein